MSDNTVLNVGVGGDTVRDLARNSGTVKTQVVQLDIGGPSNNPEVLITAGQQLMTASVPVVIASDQTKLNVSFSSAAAIYGQALAITALSGSVLANLVTSPAGYRIKGFTCNGTGDGYFYIQVNSVTMLSGRTRSTLPTLVLTLPNGIPVSTGSNVTLRVVNESGSTADYDGTLLGE